MTCVKKVLCFGVPHEASREAVLNEVPAGIELAFFDDYASQDERLDALKEADAALVWSADFPVEFYRLLSRARIIQKIGAGVDKVDLNAASSAGLLVAKTSGANNASCAELTIALILATMRRLPQAHNSAVRGRWEKWAVREGTQELRGKRVAIVGLGSIGRSVARLVSAFGAECVYYQRTRLSPEIEREINATYLPLREALRACDVLTLHLPLTPATRGLIGEDELSLMRPTSILINTARGEIVDERALHQALLDHAIFGAGLDVFAHEPLRKDEPLLSLDNVVLTPHIGGVTADSRKRLISHALTNITTVLNGGHLDPADVVQSPPEGRS